MKGLCSQKKRKKEMTMGAITQNEVKLYLSFTVIKLSRIALQSPIRHNKLHPQNPHYTR
jgi:hypothetical protein